VKVVAIIQARMGSTRLPGKVLMDLAGEPMLARVVERTGRAETLDEVVIATTVEPADADIVELCAARGWPCFRGSQDDVLDRYYRAAVERQADVVVRITSDCPLIDSGVVDRVVGEFLRNQPNVDYASNTLDPRTFPRGLDTEIMGFDALERAWHNANDPPSREHVTPYIHGHPEQFRLVAVRNDVDYSHMRWCVDTPEDRDLVLQIYEHFGHDRFSWQEVPAVLQEHPQWMELNRNVGQKVV